MPNTSRPTQNGGIFLTYQEAKEKAKTYAEKSQPPNIQKIEPSAKSVAKKPLSPYADVKVVEKTVQKVEKTRPSTTLKPKGISRNSFSVKTAKTVRFMEGF